MVGDWFLMFDHEGHLLCLAPAEWLDDKDHRLFYRAYFAPIEDETG